ncbi:MAG: nickel-dependent lactate racemase [Chloroflexi bacterium]|nr:nickel-dependent lactate racemase [Chloroflexota bacterium]
MQVHLAYGQQGLDVELPQPYTTVIEPLFEPGLPDEAAAIDDACERPSGTPPLAEIVAPEDRVVIVVPDVTRAMPSNRILPVLLRHLSHVSDTHITILVATGTHRSNTEVELAILLGEDIVRRLQVINHLGYEANALIPVGSTKSGIPVALNRHYVAATKRIVCGFIEPHFFAGFSGGPKMVCPGVAAAETIFQLHSASLIAHPNATWGVIDDNPIQQEIRDAAALVPPDFCLSVTLNRHRDITRVFAGDTLTTQAAGIAHVRRHAMRPVLQQFDIVLSTNSGFPLDLNLYQTVKGMSAAARIVRPGGTIIMAAECRDGVPSDSAFERLLHSGTSPDQLLRLITTPGFFEPEQWQVQIHAQILQRARVLLLSEGLTDGEIRAAHLDPCHSIEAATTALLDQSGSRARIAVLPEGPQTIAYLQES